MHKPISPSDFDYDAYRVPGYVAGIVSNGPIAPALEGEDEHGWSKDETWVQQAESTGACGDWAIGPYYQAHYTCGPNAAGEYMVVEENYFVTAHRWDEGEGDPDPSRRIHFDVTGMYGFTLCTDPEDPGGTEITSDYEYDDDLHALFLWTYQDARKLAESHARADQRRTLFWRKT